MALPSLGLTTTPLVPNAEDIPGLMEVVDVGNDAGGTAIDQSDSALGEGEIASGSIGAIEQLDSTPVEIGNGAPVSVNVLHTDDSSDDQFLQFGVGSDGSRSLVSVDALSGHTSSGGGMVDTDIGPQSSDGGLRADLLDFDNSGTPSGSMIDADVMNPGWRNDGTHDAIIDAEIGTGLEQPSVPSGDLAGLPPALGVFDGVLG